MSRRPLLERGLHVAVLWTLAVAAPLFRLLADQPEFLGTRGTPPGEIVVVALVIACVPPAALFVLEWMAGARVGAALHLGLVGLLAGAIALQVADPGVLPLAVAPPW